jgi:FtsX-like permease family
VTLRRRRGGYAVLALLIALVGGLAMGTLAAARRTQSSYPAYLASTNPSDLNLATSFWDPTHGSAGYDPGVDRAIAHLPHVKHVESWAALNLLPVRPNGAPADPAEASSGAGSGSVDGLYFDQDRLTVVAGRMANPARADEFMAGAAGARHLGLHVGDVVTFGVYTNVQTQSPDFGTAKVQPYRRIRIKLVGTFVASSDLVRDDVDAGGSGGAQFTPALTRDLLSCCVPLSGSGVQVDGGSRNVAAVEASIGRILPAGFATSFAPTAIVEAKAERGIKPESIALGVFGGIAALAALLIAAQVIDRQLRLAGDELEVLRALGADPAMTALDGLTGVVSAIVVGSLLAVGVAVALSPLAPLGRVRPVDPSPGIAFDWSVLGLGALVLFSVLGTLALVLAFLRTPYRVARRRTRVQRGSRLARAAAVSGLPVPAVTGIRFALEPGVGRNTVPVRSVIAGASLAIVVVTATLTFGASLDALVSRPALYGWNWTYELSAGGGNGNIPIAKASRLLGRDPSVAAWTGVSFAAVQLDGRTVPVLGGSPHAPVGPPVLSGHAFNQSDQVEVGPTTLHQLHKHVGDSVVMTNGSTKPTTLRVVGTATMPTIGVDANLHPTMGIGALLSGRLIPGVGRSTFNGSPPGPNAILVRLRHGTNAKTALRSLRRIATATSTPTDFGVAVLAVQRPAEIVNYRAMGSIPAYLGLGLAVGAISALALTLIASVRRRRRDLALLKTFGFTGRQLAATVAWQASAAVAIGTVVGLPVGIILGRSLWELFAREIQAVPAPAVPAMTLLTVTVIALMLANLVALVPGRLAARTPTALLLRSE